MSLLSVWNVDFPGGIDNENVKWRAFIWAVSEVLLVVSIAINYLPPRLYSAAFKFTIFIMMLDFFLCLIWLPIGVSRTYGFRSAKDVFTMTCKDILLVHRNNCVIHVIQIMALEPRPVGIGFYHCEFNGCYYLSRKQEMLSIAAYLLRVH